MILVIFAVLFLIPVRIAWYWHEVALGKKKHGSAHHECEIRWQQQADLIASLEAKVRLRDQDIKKLRSENRRLNSLFEKEIEGPAEVAAKELAAWIAEEEEEEKANHGS